MRSVSLAAGLVLLGAVYAIGHSLGGWRLGLLSVAAVAASRAFVYSAHLARFDVIAAALGFVGVALHFNNRAERAWVSLLSGLSVALAVEAHAHAAIFAPALGMLYLVEHPLGFFRRRHFWA